MADSPLGRTLVIANPAAHSGRGAEGADFAERFLASWGSATRGFEVRRTTGPGEAVGMAEAADGFDTVVALGGDGVIHEVVNGLMARPAADRPQLGVIPLGSGNDYARTLGMAKNDVEAALAQLVRGSARSVEVGRVNGVHFMQTLSFGLDAAIALDTTDRRAADTSQEGEALFVTSGLKILSHAKGGFACTARFDDEAPLELSTLIFAIQVGPSYGGGFCVCPDADPTDGQLDVCYNVRVPALPHLLALFGLARWWRHAGSSAVCLRRVRRAELDFAVAPPCQVDGERLEGTHFSVEVVPGALRVIFPR
ncbi:diacylglycerol/lipid kinase family protein [Olsenella profusa]|uniref:Diacylglycerol kinase family lipid kinase n=1 Tax=Olsenella profusa TaxID=138595 RepID=A0ABS2F0A0_9ACTN|nr:diacylglycerol kinase family protein [Olsenella profusa]MBM6773997.1 diacylglycerol kinase family lipid kinase [Olsenella profusa]